MTKKIITMEPARKIRATPPSEGSVQLVSTRRASLVGEDRENLRPAMVVSGTETVKSAEGILLRPQVMEVGALRDSRWCQQVDGMQTMRTVLPATGIGGRVQGESWGQVIAYLGAGR